MSAIDDAVSLWYGLDPWQQTALQFAVILVVGALVVRTATRIVDRAIHKAPHLDDTLRRFLDTLTEIVGWTILAVVLLGVLGVDATALAGGLAIGGFVIGFALKDTLGNVAAGVMLLVYRPFNVSDTVTIGGQSGEVIQIGMGMTRLKAADGRLVMVPNGKVLGDTVVNHTREPIRRADVVVGIEYGADIDQAIKAILAALAGDPRVLAEPAAGVRVTQLADSSVNLQVRPWVNTSDYWQAQADFHGVVKRALEGAGIGIPFPQRDLHIRTGSVAP